MRVAFTQESAVYDWLDGHDVMFTSNPRNWGDWCLTNIYRNENEIKQNYDCKFCVKGRWYRVEIKFTSKPIYHSWFMRDWFGRDCDIIVCNSPYDVSYQDRKMLAHKGVKLLSNSMFFEYVSKLLSDNKYCCLNVFGVDSLDCCQCLLVAFVGGGKDG